MSDNRGMGEGEITAVEKETVMEKLKGNNAPGPDKAFTELAKLLDKDNRGHLRQSLSESWEGEKAPSSVTAANIASLFTKGDM